MHHFREVFRRGSQIEDDIAFGLTFPVEVCERFFQAGKSLIVIEIARDVVQSFFQPLPGFGVDLISGKSVYVVAETFAKLIIIEFRSRHANDCEIIRQQVLVFQIVKRGNQFALGEITGGTKDYECARVCLVTVSPSPRRSYQRNRVRSLHDFFTA